MRTAGIVMECNPFHAGHRYIIGKAREIAGEGGHVVVVMSGAFAQRGIPAVDSPGARTGQVLDAGADLVLELPVRYATAGAGYFAEGSAALLARTGIVTDLVFGSECGDIGHLTRCARFLAEEPGDYQALLRDYLAKGYSWPAARAAAASACQDAVALPDTPNDLLGAEYLRALRLLSADDAFPEITPHALPRIPAVSASSLREQLASKDEGLHPDDFSGMLLEKLLMIDHGVGRYDFADYAGVSVDLANRIRRLLPQFVSWTQFCGLLKTRNLTWTAVSRALTHILLDITADTLPANAHRHDRSGPDCAAGIDGTGGPGAVSGKVKALIPYARVLGCRREALPLLGAIRGKKLPLITSRADADHFLPEGSRERRLLDGDLYAAQTWDLAARMKSSAKAHKHNETAQAPAPEPCAVSEFSKPLLIL